LKILDDVSSTGNGAGIAASSRKGSTSNGTKVSNLYKYFKYIFLTIPGIYGSPKYINNQRKHFNIYDVFYSQCSRQHVSAGIPAIFRVRFLVQEYKRTYRSFATTMSQLKILVQEYKRTYRSFATTMSQLKISDFSGETFKGFEVL
jgi:hypothetical protein